MNGKTAVKECEFAQEIRYHVLPTEKDVIGHYFYHRNQIMCRRKEFLNKSPPFNICKENVLDVLEAVWAKSSLPTIGRKSMETKLKKLLKTYSDAKKKKIK